jgi:hypothetical protein
VAAPDPLQVIQATLAPAFLMSAVSIFLNFTQARLFRVVDRARETPAPEEAMAHAALLGRARLLRNAIALEVLAVALAVVAAVLILASQLADVTDLLGLAPLTFALAMLALLVALAAVLWDTVLSVRSVARDERAAQ